MDKSSLFNTIDNVSEAILFGFNIPADEKRKVADFIISRKINGAHADTFAPTDLDAKRDLELFTGEKITSRVGKYHMIGEEACRILRKLELSESKVDTALKKADNGLKMQIAKVYDKSCSCGLWLNIASGGLNNDTKFLQSGLTYLKKHRDNKGGWKGFSGYYVLYVLNEMDVHIAIDELKYTGKLVERKLKMKRTEATKYDVRRNYICEQILNKINSNQ